MAAPMGFDSAWRIDNVSRRGLLAGLAAGSGLVLAVTLVPWRGILTRKRSFGAAGMPHGTVSDPRAFVAIDPDGTVTILCHRAEMGQGVRTGLPLVVADELEADWSRVRVMQAPADEARFGNQDTDGSRSTRHFFEPMRRCGAAARMMIESAAAARWNIDVAAVEARNGVVIDTTSDRRAAYGELAAEAAALPVPSADQVRLKDPARFRYIGKEGIDLVDGFAITTGRAPYAQDIRLPGMTYAVIARPPVLGGKVTAFDASQTLKVAGVLKVVHLVEPTLPSGFLPSGGIAVIAENTYAAIEGRAALKISWDDGAHGTYESKAYRRTLEDSARQPGVVLRSQGDALAHLAAAARTVEANYYIPHLAHAPMEPPAATVRIREGKCEAWAGVQSPQAARDLLARGLGLAPEDVTVHVTLIGGGFGRKSKPDFVLEAGLLSKAMAGAPVKVVWTREDDIRNGFYHTVSVERLEAGLDAAGKAIAWRHNSVAPTIQSIFTLDPRHEMPFEAGMGLLDMPFDIKHVLIENGAAEAHTKIGWFRSISNLSHAFAIQCFVCELAAAAGRDPKDYLLELIGPARLLDLRPLVSDFWDYGEDPQLYPIDTARLRGVIELAAREAGWGRKHPKGRGLGLAVHRSFLTYVAAVIEVEVDTKGNVAVPRVDVAVDCGPLVNPDRVRAQMEGAVVMGLTLALKSEITFTDGRVMQSNFDDYDVVRINEAPVVTHVHIVPHTFDVPLGGVGEPGLPPIAPALLNAIFAATGKRIRSLPIGTQLMQS